ncbi:MAG: hypothetical protein NWS69_11645 [Pseudomonadales bacterium]|nr:hypothetical protein [Pseudomonadales bacterium]MDP4874738.1 hypothetical protein [Pseudomonadales bacterium]
MIQLVQQTIAARGIVLSAPRQQIRLLNSIWYTRASRGKSHASAICSTALF